MLCGACSSDNSPVITHKESKEIGPKHLKANRILSIDIEGMTCVMGCGASIRKELFSTNAVSSVEFDFKEGRKTNIAKIAFDKDKISVDKIVELLSKLNEKQFKIGATSSEEYNTKTSSMCSPEQSASSAAENCGTAVGTCKIESSASKIELPNFLNLLSRFFVN
jgi:copper chaperone CopZ